jgi:hypothetical protein
MAQVDSIDEFKETVKQLTLGQCAERLTVLASEMARRTKKDEASELARLQKVVRQGKAAEAAAAGGSFGGLFGIYAKQVLETAPQHGWEPFEHKQKVGSTWEPVLKSAGQAVDTAHGQIFKFADGTDFNNAHALSLASQRKKTNHDDWVTFEQSQPKPAAAPKKAGKAAKVPLSEDALAAAKAEAERALEEKKRIAAEKRKEKRDEEKAAKLKAAAEAQQALLQLAAKKTSSAKSTPTVSPTLAVMTVTPAPLKPAVKPAAKAAVKPAAAKPAAKVVAVSDDDDEESDFECEKGEMKPWSHDGIDYLRDHKNRIYTDDGSDDVGEYVGTYDKVSRTIDASIPEKQKK